MAQYKQNTNATVLVKLVSSSTGSPLAGVASGTVNATALKADGSTATISVSNSNWTEITTGTYSGQGVYTLGIPSGTMNVLGFFSYAVNTTGSVVYTGWIEVVTGTATEIFNTQGTPANGTIAADIAQVEGQTVKIGTPVSASIALDIAGVRGTQNLDLSTIAGGAAFNSSTDSLHNLEGSITSGGINPSQVADAVWSQVMTSYTTSNTAGFNNKLLPTINTKTSALPSDPASQSAVMGPQALSISQIAGGVSWLTTDTLHNIAQIPSTMWDTSVTGHSTASTFGAEIQSTFSKTSNLPSNPASTTDVTNARDSIKGAQLLDISTIAGGALFNSSTDTLHSIDQAITSGGINPASIASAVWTAAVTSYNSTSGTFGFQWTNDVRNKTVNLPVDPASNTAVSGFISSAQSNIKGGSNLSITDIAGSGWSSSSDTLHLIRTAIPVGGPTLSAIVSGVWNEALSSHSSAGSAGKILQDTETFASNAAGGTSVVQNQAIADAVWNSLLGNYTNFGSAGSLLDGLALGFNSADIAQAVWDEPLSNHIVTSTFGKTIGNNANNFSILSVVDGLESSTNAIVASTQATVNSLRADYTTTRAGKIDFLDLNISTVNTTVNAVQATATHLQRIGEGHWKIFTSGPDANRLVLYSNDGTTVLQKWDLRDQSGAPTTVNVFERIPNVSIP